MRHIRSGFAIFLNLIACLTLVAANSGPISIIPRHCYALISPVSGSANNASKVLETACYDTFSQAVEAATAGRVRLDPSTRPEDVTDAMLSPSVIGALPDAQAVIGIDWENTNFAGSSYTWVANDFERYLLRKMEL